MLRWYLSRTPHFFSNWLWPYCASIGQKLFWTSSSFFFDQKCPLIVPKYPKVSQIKQSYLCVYWHDFVMKPKFWNPFHKLNICGVVPQSEISYASTVNTSWRLCSCSNYTYGLEWPKKKQKMHWGISRRSSRSPQPQVLQITTVMHGSYHIR